MRRRPSRSVKKSSHPSPPPPQEGGGGEASATPTVTAEENLGGDGEIRKRRRQTQSRQKTSKESKWSVYLIISSRLPRTYVGVTTNFPRRLKQHNGTLKGGAKAACAGRPWSLACIIQGFKNRSEDQDSQKQSSGVSPDKQPELHRVNSFKETTNPDTAAIANQCVLKADLKQDDPTKEDTSSTMQEGEGARDVKGAKLVYGKGVSVKQYVDSACSFESNWKSISRRMHCKKDEQGASSPLLKHREAALTRVIALSDSRSLSIRWQYSSD